MKIDSPTWTPNPNNYKELVDSLRDYKQVKYVVWSAEGVRVTIKEDGGEKDTILFENENSLKDTVKKVKDFFAKAGSKTKKTKKGVGKARSAVKKVVNKLKKKK